MRPRGWRSEDYGDYKRDEIKGEKAVAVATRQHAWFVDGENGTTCLRCQRPLCEALGEVCK